MSKQRTYQFRNVAAGLCLKCPRAIYRAGLCERHTVMNLDAANRWTAARRTKGKPHRACSSCGAEGHNRRTCELRRRLAEVLS